MKAHTKKTPVLTASALGLLLASLPHSGHAASGEIPPEVLKQLETLSRQVQELQKQVKAQQVPVYQPVAANPADIEALQQKVLVLERKQEIASEELADQKKKAPVVVAGDKGFGLKSADGKYEFKLRGLLQADARVFDDGIKGLHTGVDSTTRSATDNFVVRRARPIIEGKLGDTYGFRITSDFGGGSSSLIDAYIDGNYHEAAKVRVGKFTPPIGLERLQSSADTKFNELGLPSNFIPSRDVGVQVGGDVLNKTLNYTVGVFNGANDGANGDNDGNTDKELAARLFAQPFANSPGFLQGLGFGVGISTGNARGTTGATNLANYRTSGQENFFSYRTDTSATNTVFADGERKRFVPQLSYYNGAFGLTSEYAQVDQEVTRVFAAGANNVRKEELSHDAWQVTASYLLTGEEASFKGVKPANPFDPANGAWGAWEVVARAGELNIDESAFYGRNGVLGANDSFAQATRSAQSADNFAVGLNWYPNQFTRVSLDYEQTKFDWGGGGTAANPQDRDDERVLIGRVQASF